RRAPLLHARDENPRHLPRALLPPGSEPGGGGLRGSGWCRGGSRGARRACARYAWSCRMPARGQCVGGSPDRLRDCAGKTSKTRSLGSSRFPSSIRRGDVVTRPILNDVTGTGATASFDSPADAGGSTRVEGRNELVMDQFERPTIQ